MLKLTFMFDASLSRFGMSLSTRGLIVRGSLSIEDLIEGSLGIICGNIGGNRLKPFTFGKLS